MNIKLSKWQYYELWIFMSVLFLMIFGIVEIQSAIAGSIELANHAQRQLLFGIVGIFVMFIVSNIDYSFWGSVDKYLYISIVLALFILNVVASAVFGASRWFKFLTINIQPAELSKIVLILVLAKYLARNQNRIRDISIILRSLLIAMGIIVGVLIQPSLSNSIILIVIWFSLLWASGLPLKYLALFIIGGIIPAIFIIPLLIQSGVVHEYQIARVTAFLFPDPSSSYGDNYNVHQALISIGSGGFWGQGYGHGSQVQLRFLRVRHSDYIFSAIANEFGFAGAFLILILMLFLVLRCLRVARLARDTYGGLIAYGVAVLLAFQSIINIGVNLNFIPVTGVTLPFVSYGGSSLLTNLIGIGLVESVMIHRKYVDFNPV